MSLEYSVNFYDTSSLDARNALIGLVSRATITHVGLQVDSGSHSIEYSCLDKNRGLSILNPEAFARLCSPVDTVKLGIVDKPLPEVPKLYPITARSLIYYHFIGKYIGSAMPNGCCVYVSNVLVDMGLIKKPIFYPEKLYKELKKCR